MISLSTLTNTTKQKDKKTRRGRGVGTGRGKTSGRGHKGAKARSGYKRRLGNEGGNTRLYMKLPTRGFNSKMFEKPVFHLNLYQIEALFNEGDLVNIATLKEKGCLAKTSKAKLKILSVGEIKNKVKVQAHFASKGALEKMKTSKIEFEILTNNKKVAVA
jgi:large subunit ribosomal protein L15